MGSGGTTALRPPGQILFIRPLLRSDLICIRLKIFSHPPKHLRRCKVKPHGSLVPVSSTHRCAYTPAYQRRRLQRSFRTLKESGRTHLGASFVLRCFQHLSLPHLATGQCHWHDNPNTSDASTPVPLVLGAAPSVLQRPRQIGTELSHDVLNPARVPL